MNNEKKSSVLEKMLNYTFKGRMAVGSRTGIIRAHRRKQRTPLEKILFENINSVKRHVLNVNLGNSLIAKLTRNKLK